MYCTISGGPIAPSRRPNTHPTRTSTRSPVFAAMVVLFLALSLGCEGGGDAGGEETAAEDRLAEVRRLQTQGQLQPSLDILREMISDGSRDGEVMYRYGRGLALAGFPGRGFWALDTALGDPEWFVLASHQLAMDAYRSGNYDVALETLERLQAERTDDVEDLPARLLELRARVESRRMYEESIELADTILEDHPDHDVVKRMKAVALLGLKETDAAYEIIREAGIGEPEDAAPEAGTAEARDEFLTPLDAQGLPSELAAAQAAGDPTPTDASDTSDTSDSPEAEPTLSSAQSDARSAYWCQVRATFKRESGELKEAEKILDECLDEYPANPGLLSEAGDLYPLVGRASEIVDRLRAALEVQPENGEVRITLVRFLDISGKDDEAEEVLVGAIQGAREAFSEEAPQTRARLAARLVDLGAFLVDHGRGEEGIDFFGEAIELAGDQASPDLLFRQAEALILDERYDEAIAIAERSAAEVHAPIVRGRVAFERGEYAKAVEELDEAARIWPNHAPTRYYLARAREGVGDFDVAIEDYRQAIRSDPQLSAPRERLSRLHLAESRVRQAGTILKFISPKKSSTPSGAMWLLGVEAQIRLGQDPDLTYPNAPDLAFEELRQGTVRSIARGLSAGVDPLVAEAALASSQSKFPDPVSRSYFYQERVPLLIEAGEKDRAVEVGREAVEFADTPGNRLTLAKALVAAGSALPEARELLESADRSALAKGDARLATTWGSYHARTGDAAAAIAAFERALEIDEGHWPALEGLTRQLVETNRTKAAEALLERFVARGNPYEGRGALALAQLSTSRSDAEEIRLTEQAIRFGAGLPALDHLREIAPERASEYRVEIEEAVPQATPPGGVSGDAPEGERDAA